jgi:FAD/FMN-containing dehydrogenase
MGLLRDWHYIERAVEIPALSEMIREALIRALFVRDDRVLPASIVADLNRGPAVTVRVKDDAEIRKLVRVLNGQESAVSLGLSAEDYHYFRTRLGVGRAREFGLIVRPKTLLTYDWIVPEQRGVQLDFSAYAEIEFAEAGYRTIAQVGATWKRLYDEALARDQAVPVVPTVPLDFAIGDALCGDAPLASYRGELAAHVNGVRTISPYGHRARIGFEEVANNGTAYDLLHATLPMPSEFVVPLALALRLEPKPAARKTLTYGFDDGSKLTAALDRLTQSGQAIAWVHITDAAAAKALRPGSPAEPFTVQISVGGSVAGVAAKEKAVDAAFAGFKSKASDVPNPFDVPAEAYRKTAGNVERGLFVGEIRIPAKAFGDFAARVRAYGDQMAAKAGLYASARETGTVSVFPFFSAPKDRTKAYDLSKGVNTIAAKVPGAAFVSRLAHLWSEDPAYLRRMDFLRRLKLEIDTAHVMQPLVAP